MPTNQTKPVPTNPPAYVLDFCRIWLDKDGWGPDQENDDFYNQLCPSCGCKLTPMGAPVRFCSYCGTELDIAEATLHDGCKTGKE